MGRARALATAFAATWRAMLGDAAAFLMLFVAGWVYSFFYPYPYEPESVRRVPVVVVDQDRSALSRQIIRYAQAHPSVAVLAVAPDLVEAQALVWSGEAAKLLYLPGGLQSRVLAGQPAIVEITSNGVYSMLNKAVLSGLGEVVGTVSAGIELKRLQAASPSRWQVAEQRAPLRLDSIGLFNVREGYGSSMMPAVAVIIVQQTLIIAIALMMGSWAERGQGPPVARSGSGYLGMMAAFASVVLLNGGYFFGFVYWWQGYPRGGNFAGMAALLLLFAWALAALGLLLGSLFRTRERSVQLLLASAMPMLFLSGVNWPVSALPQPLQWLRWLLPSTAGIQGFTALNQRGASWSQVTGEATALAAMALLCSVIGLWRWRRVAGGGAPGTRAR